MYFVDFLKFFRQSYDTDVHHGGSILFEKTSASSSLALEAAFFSFIISFIRFITEVSLLTPKINLECVAHAFL